MALFFDILQSDRLAASKEEDVGAVGGRVGRNAGSGVRWQTLVINMADPSSPAATAPVADGPGFDGLDYPQPATATVMGNHACAPVARFNGNGRAWFGFEPGSITDANLMHMPGMDRPRVTIPDRAMAGFGHMAAKDSVTVDEFKAALEYVPDGRWVPRLPRRCVMTCRPSGPVASGILEGMKC